MTPRPEYSLLYGLPVKTVHTDEDGAGIVFSNERWPKGAWIIIYGRAAFSPKELTFKDLVGRDLIDLRWAKDVVSFRFSGGALVTVGLKDEDYEGPERIQIELPNGTTVVE